MRESRGENEKTLKEQLLCSLVAENYMGAASILYNLLNPSIDFGNNYFEESVGLLADGTVIVETVSKNSYTLYGQPVLWLKTIEFGGELNDIYEDVVDNPDNADILDDPAEIESIVRDIWVEQTYQSLVDRATEIQEFLEKYILTREISIEVDGEVYNLIATYRRDEHIRTKIEVYFPEFEKIRSEEMQEEVFNKIEKEVVETFPIKFILEDSDYNHVTKSVEIYVWLCDVFY